MRTLRWWTCFLGAALLVATTEARADAPPAGDWSGLRGPLIATFVIANAVPDYSLVSFDDERHSGAQWDLPFEFKLGLTQTIAPSITWYPGADDVDFRATWRIQLPVSDAAEVAFGFSPGVGVFTTGDHGSGYRLELRAWAAFADGSGWAPRRFPGLFIGGAIEQDRTYNTRGWELVAGFEFPIPIDMLLFDAEE